MEEEEEEEQVTHAVLGAEVLRQSGRHNFSPDVGRSGEMSLAAFASRGRHSLVELHLH